MLSRRWKRGLFSGDCERSSVSPLQIEVPALAADSLRDSAGGESSAVVRTRVDRARKIQLDRQGKPNSLLLPRELDAHCPLDANGDALPRHAIAQLSLSARAYHRVLKIARPTIADMTASPLVDASHVADAIDYRRGMNQP